MKGNHKVFDINEYIQNNRILNQAANQNIDRFNDVVKQTKDYFKSLYSSDKTSDKDKVQRFEIEHNAIIGDEGAESLLTSEINNYLRENNISNVKYPSFYDSLPHAIFHEIYRFGVFYKWNKYPNSPSAKIQGKELWFKVDGEFIKQEEELQDESKVDEIIRAFQLSNKGLKINESNPQAEIEMKDGTRVTIVIPPRAFKPTIIFRRFIVKSFSFSEQAKFNTIPLEDVHFYHTMANLDLNTVIAGHVESGKTTMLKTFYGSRNDKKVALLIESSPESYLKRDFPNRLVHDFYTLNSDINEVIRTALRVDHDYMIVQEVRGIEAEGAISGTERGTRGLLMTYHITNPAKTTEQLAQHITDVFPNRRLTNEVRRISKQLDIGITMQNFKGNKKKITSVYEICYDYDKDRAWINYLIKYDKKMDKWVYNSDVSEGLLDNIYEFDENLGKKFINHLKSREKDSPMTTTKIQPIIFKE
ncbi:CpaF/VirB11 family protein [Cytobacillus oceanisediminis]|uniref:ATPase, T2SS/T4P/T4SS family n=1 Tax=Cytobacillus oceanisediminis TaxID=665099 RepID=UPI001C23D281|nr:ATPase, T2SS/T4P/T4SS family [Cytobacillus oceanisediminis]MBU8732498.1 CpaF/VirB11 family protein [Cytobacillus oceanisediminis]